METNRKEQKIEQVGGSKFIEVVRMDKILDKLDELSEIKLVIRIQVGNCEKLIQSSLTNVLLLADLSEEGSEDDLHFGSVQRIATVCVVVFEQSSCHLNDLNFAAHLWNTLMEILCFLAMNQVFIFHGISSSNFIWCTFGISQSEFINPLTFPVMTTHIVTQIKKEVQDARLRQYSANKQKKELKYFSLYLKEIVKIQRQFRKYLVRKTRALEQQISQELQKKQLLHFQHKRLDSQIQQAKQRRQKLLCPSNPSSTLQKQISQQKQNISGNIRQIIRNVVHCADDYARNAALSKISLGELQRLRKEEKELTVQVKELELEKQCYEQRIGTWGRKLRELRERIVEEGALKREAERELQQYQ